MKRPLVPCGRALEPAWRGHSGHAGPATTASNGSFFGKLALAGDESLAWLACTPLPLEVLLMNTHFASSFQDQTEGTFVSWPWERHPLSPVGTSDEPGMLMGPRLEPLSCSPNLSLMLSMSETARSIR